jgi:hypothetical protein
MMRVSPWFIQFVIFPGGAYLFVRPATVCAQGGSNIPITLPAGFRALESAHFVVRSDAAPQRIEQLLAGAEETYAAVEAFADRLKLPVTTPAARMHVLLFDDWQAYQAHAARGGFEVNPLVPGYFDEGSNRCCLFNIENTEVIVKKRQELLLARAELNESGSEAKTADSQKAVEDRQKRIREIEQQLARLTVLLHTTVIRHEIAHQVLLNLGIQKPAHRDRRWLKEGLAMQFETAAPPNAHRLVDLRMIDPSRGPLTARQLIQRPALLGPGAPSAQEAYAASYALVWYLIETRPAALRDYLLREGEAPFDARRELALFEEAFGEVTPTFERRWQAHAGVKRP